MNTSIVEYLKTVCQQTPDACAVIFQDAHYSYAELDRWSDQIALGLEALGVNPGERIGLYLEKSVEALACIYGVLKMGACYVPMSPVDPVSKTTHMMKNCSIRFILVSAPVKSELDTTLNNEKVVKVDVNDLLTDKKNSTQVFTAGAVSTEEDAAVLYTSGSTGNPKGAVITHGNLAVFVNWAVNYFSLTSNDFLLSHAPLQFDLSFFDIFAAAAAGATVVLAEPDDTTNAFRIARLVNETAVTVWQSVPSALSLLIASGQDIRMPGVRQVLFAGEPIPRQTLLNLPKLFPKARLHNIYGCTETNDTFIYSLPENIQEAPDPLPIGRVLPHIHYRIVDQSNRDVAIGEEGVLMVSGNTVMAGYLGIAASSVMTDGYYRTNDLVSEGENGLLQFHGRIDSVVKTNGYRVNLTEIEDYLSRSGKCKEVALFCVNDVLKGQRIVAIIRPSPGIQCSPLNLKIYCARGLPKYAIPHSFYITEDELPKGRNGKIDRRCISSRWQQKHLERKSTQ